MTDNYLSQAFSDLYKEDGLLVLARGLGINRLLSKFIQHYVLSSIEDVKNNRKSLVFCINAFDNKGLVDDNTYINNICNQLLSEGLMPHELPKIITNEINSQERCDIYNNDSGVFFITSRILIVDMLDNKINPANILGFLVPNAHRVTENTIEAFILRVFRESNSKGFIKGFTEEPEHLIIPNSKLDKCLKLLFLKKLYIYPRFHSVIHNTFMSKGNQPQVIEINIELSNAMKLIQNGILVAIKNCYYELKRSISGTIHQNSVIDEIFTNYNNNDLLFYNYYDHLIRNTLDNDYHRLSYRIKNLLYDIKELKTLLDYLLKYDSFSFYYYLLKLKQTSFESHSSPSLWLTSEAANQIFTKSKDRVYKVKSKSKLLSKNYSIPNYISIDCDINDVIIPILECPPKWKALSNILLEINQNKHDNTSNTTKHRVLIIVKDNLTLNQLRDYLLNSEEVVMDVRYRWFISHQCADIKNKCNVNSKSINKSSNQQSSTKPFVASSGLKRNRNNNRSINLLPVIDEIDKSDSNLNIDDNVNDNKILGINKNHFQSLSTEDKLLLLEENRLHNLKPNKNPEDVESNIILGKRGRDEDDNLDDDNNTDELIIDSENESNVINTYIDKDTNIRLFDDNQIVIATHTQCTYTNSDIMNDLQPTHIVIYDVDITIIRNIEVYQVNRKVDYPLVKVFILSYNESAERHRYVDALSHEKKSFELLISRKQDLVINLPDLKPDLQRAKQEDNELITDSRQLHKEYNIISEKSNKQSKRVSLQTSIDIQTPSIVVDVREFRSSLPSLLHINGFKIIPRTLTVGDYIISSNICIERKGIMDLFQSFQSGRLYNQVTSMVKYYKYPCLLIEFTNEKSFSLQSVSDISPDIQTNSINTRMSVLALTFPTLRILWSRSPQDTSVIFHNLLIKHIYEPIDVDKVVQIGLEPNDSMVDSSDNRQTAIEILLSIPGIDKSNYHEIVKHVNNLKELSKLSESDLAPLIGPINAKKTINFFKQRVI